MKQRNIRSLGWISACMALAFSMIVGMAAPASATIESIPLAVDKRIRTVLYNPHAVFKFVGHYGFQSSIEFDKDEVVETISLGDSVAWQITPQGHRIFLKPVELDADTNMTVITDQRTYHFELYARNTEDMRDDEMIFVVRFVYPKTKATTSSQSRRIESFLPDFKENPSRFNFNYTLSGPRNISPIRIFDDSEFTYFEFPATTAQDLPAVFMVGPEQNESLVNFRMRNNFLIVERVAQRFTLRHGSDVVCVYNEKLLPADGSGIAPSYPASPYQTTPGQHNISGGGISQMPR